MVDSIFLLIQCVNESSCYSGYNPKYSSNAYGQQDLPIPQNFNGGGYGGGYNQGMPPYSTNAYLREGWLGGGFNQGYGGGYGAGPSPAPAYNAFSPASPFHSFYSRSGYNGYGGFPNSFAGNHHTGYSGYANSYGPPPLPGFNGYSGDGSPFGTFEPPLGASFGPRFLPPQPTRARQVYPLEPEEEFERAHEPMFRPVGTVAQQLTPTTYGYSYVGYIRRQVA